LLFISHAKCVNKVMRLIWYKIICRIIRLNQHCPLQNNIHLMEHTWRSEFSAPHGRTESQLLIGYWWRRLQTSERCEVFQNDNPWASILILGTSKNHKVTNQDNVKPAEAWKFTFFARNSRTDNNVCARARCRDLQSNRLRFPFDLLGRSLSQTVQDFEITIVIPYSHQGVHILCGLVA
jgi:hypothetical protein